MKQYLLCAVDDARTATARRFDVGAHRIALVRLDDDFYPRDTCSHADYSLSEGESTPKSAQSNAGSTAASSVSMKVTRGRCPPRGRAGLEVHVEEGSVYVSIEVAMSELVISGLHANVRVRPLAGRRSRRAQREVHAVMGPTVRASRRWPTC